MNLEEFLIAECNLREQEEENERRDVEANKRRAKERVRERKRDAFFNCLYEHREWIVPVGLLVLAMLMGTFVLILEAVL